MTNVSAIEQSCTTMEGRSLRKQLFAQVKEQVGVLNKQGINPELHVVLAGDDASSLIYVNAKMRAAKKVGIQSVLHHLPSDVTQQKLEDLLCRLADNPNAHGILLQLPLPKGIKKNAALACIPLHKDVDGLTVGSMGALVAKRKKILKPCTPLGIMRLLKAYEVPIKGQTAVVLGRSQLVGRPVAEMLSQANATVISCHRFTPNITTFTRQADILIVATGSPSLVTGDMLKAGATVVDVGITRLDNGDVVGDCDAASCRKVASLLTPVPGGVGPMTVATLMTNTIDACCIQHNLTPPFRAL